MMKTWNEKEAVENLKKFSESTVEESWHVVGWECAIERLWS
jgi:hypothetical protein